MHAFGQARHSVARRAQAILPSFRVLYAVSCQLIVETMLMRALLIATAVLLTLPLCWLLWREWRRLKLACAPLSRPNRKPLGARQQVQLARRAG